MSGTGIKHKLKVFISSRCGEKYTIARNALQKLLETTGLIETYVYEKEPASSEDNRSSYLNYVDESNLLIVLVDNIDDISGAVKSEIQRAKSKELRILYIFCDENSKKPTSLQETIIQDQSQKFAVVHEFSDTVSAAYDSVMQDIISVYKVKKSQFRDDNNDEGGFSSSAALTITNGLSPIKDYRFTYVSKVLTAGIVPSDPTIKESEETALEQLLSSHLQTVIHKRVFNEETIDELCSEALKLHCMEMQELLKMRFSIQKLYYRNEFDECLKELQKAFEIALNDVNIPEWIANDIAIDIRHVVSRIDELKGQITIENPGQKHIDESTEPVYYPYLDRLVYNMHEEVSKHYYKQLTTSPYTTNYGGIEPMFKYLASAFCVAEIFGSIVQTEITRDRLITIYSMLCTLYDDHDLFVEYIRLLIVNRNEKELDAIIRANNQTVELMNQKDIQIVLDSINMLFDDDHKMKAKFLIASHFGYYMSSESYDSLCDELLDYAAGWVIDDDRVFSYNKLIFDLLKGCKSRTPIEKTIGFILLCFNNEKELLYDDCFKLMSKIDFSKVSCDDQESIKQVLLRLLSSKKKFHSYNNAVICFCKSSTIQFDDFEMELSNVDPAFYKSDFMLELTGDRNGDFADYIYEQLETVKERNKALFETGAYYGYGYEPFDVINRIVSYYDPEINEKMVESIIETAFDTLGTERQTVKTKMSAVSLLQRLYCKNVMFKRWDDTIKVMKEKKTIFSSGVNLGIFDKENNTNLAFQYELFLSLFGKERQEALINSLFSIESSESYNVIQALRLISIFLDDVNGAFDNEMVIISFLNYSIFMLQHRERDVKHFATECLIRLTNYKVTNSIAALQLSRILDSGNVDEKITILQQIDRIKTNNTDLRERIISSGKVDNHYFVRHLANSID